MLSLRGLLDIKVKLLGYVNFELGDNVRVEDVNLLVIIIRVRLIEYLENE